MNSGDKKLASEVSKDFLIEDICINHDSYFTITNGKISFGKFMDGFKFRGVLDKYGLYMADTNMLIDIIDKSMVFLQTNGYITTDDHYTEKFYDTYEQGYKKPEYKIGKHKKLKLHLTEKCKKLPPNYFVDKYNERQNIKQNTKLAVAMKYSTFALAIVGSLTLLFGQGIVTSIATAEHGIILLFSISIILLIINLFRLKPSQITNVHKTKN